MAEVTTTPVLYDFYGKQYDYNDLAQAADSGLNEYLGTLSRGQKDNQQFRDAYANMMAGIKDGSITFGDNQFHDTQGRYTNADKVDRDYYGLVANYIYSKMGKSNPYQAPVSPEEAKKIKWDNNSVRTALMREIFNNDTPTNVQDFIDLDELKDGARGNANRMARLATAFQKISNNWDSTFTGFADSDKVKYQQLLGDATTALRDGSINAGDYLALSKAVGGDLDFRTLLATTSAPTTPSVATNIPEVNKPTATASHKLKSASLVADGYSSEDINYMTNIMSRVKNPQGLVNILRNSFYNRNYRFAKDPKVYAIFKDDKISSRAGITATLNALYARGYLKAADPSNPNLYYIPGLRTKQGTAWVWDRANNQIAELQQESIPYLKAKLSQVQSNKHGGILYAAAGATVPNWYDSIKDFTGTYNTNWGSTLYGINDKGVYGNAYGNSGMGQNNARYKTDSGYSDYSDKGKTYATNVEGQQYYKDFTNSLLEGARAYQNATDKSTLNDDNNVFLKWAHLVDKSLPQGSASSFFDDKGNLRTSWKVSNKDSYMRGPRGEIKDLSEYISAIRNDQLLANRHNDLMKEGKRYFYTDKAGVKHWVDPEIAKNYQLKSGDPTRTTEGITNWSDYEIVGPKTDSTQTGTQSGTGDKTGTDIDGTEEKPKEPGFWEKIKQEILDNALPLGAEAGLLGLSLHTNNKIDDVLKKSDRVSYHNPWEFHTPVTGAFSEMELRNRQAADVRRMANNTNSTDSSENRATALDTNRQATDLEIQGFLANDKEIQRTKEIALQNAKEGIANRNQVANYNADQTAEWRRRQGQYEAQRRYANYQGIANFVANNISAPLKERAAYNLSQRRQDEFNKKNMQLNLDMAPIARQQNYQASLLENYYARKQKEIQQKYSSEFNKLYQDNADDINYDITTSDAYQNMQKELYALQDQQMRDSYDMSNYFDSQNRIAYNNIYNNQRGGVYNKNPFGTQNQKYKDQNWYKILNGLQVARRGGKLRVSTQNLLNKIIK